VNRSRTNAVSSAMTTVLAATTVEAGTSVVSEPARETLSVRRPCVAEIAGISL
jgi:hypothetical protein